MVYEYSKVTATKKHKKPRHIPPSLSANASLSPATTHLFPLIKHDHIRLLLPFCGLLPEPPVHRRLLEWPAVVQALLLPFLAMLLLLLLTRLFNSLLCRR